MIFFVKLTDDFSIYPRTTEYKITICVENALSHKETTSVEHRQLTFYLDENKR